MGKSCCSRSECTPLKVPKSWRRIWDSFPATVWFGPEYQYTINGQQIIYPAINNILPYRITIWESDGRVIYDNVDINTYQINQGTTAENVYALVGLDRVVYRRSPTTGIWYYFWANAVCMNGRTLVVRLGFTSYPEC